MWHSFSHSPTERRTQYLPACRGTTPEPAQYTFPVLFKTVCARNAAWYAHRVRNQPIQLNRYPLTVGLETSHAYFSWIAVGRGYSQLDCSWLFVNNGYLRFSHLNADPQYYCHEGSTMPSWLHERIL